MKFSNKLIIAAILVQIVNFIFLAGIQKVVASWLFVILLSHLLAVIVGFPIYAFFVWKISPSESKKKLMQYSFSSLPLLAWNLFVAGIFAQNTNLSLLTTVFFSTLFFSALHFLFMVFVIFGKQQS